MTERITGGEMQWMNRWFWLLLLVCAALPNDTVAETPTEAQITGCWKATGGSFRGAMRLLENGVGETWSWRRLIGFDIYWQIDSKTGLVGTEVAGFVTPRTISWMRYDAAKDELVAVQPDAEGRIVVYRRVEADTSWCETGEWSPWARTHLRRYQKGVGPRTTTR